MSDEMDGKRQFDMVRRQIEEMWRTGESRDVDCPYCGGTVLSGERICCALMHKAVLALIEARQHALRQEMAERIMEKTLVN